MPAHLIVYLLGRERPTNDPFVPYIRSLSVCGIERGNDQLSRDTQRGGHPLRGRNKIVIGSPATPGFSSVRRREIRILILALSGDPRIGYRWNLRLLQPGRSFSFVRDMLQRPVGEHEPVPPLRGMLHKKHQNSRFANWGKRYFEVDDKRGMLYYFRTRAAQEWDEPARHFMLSALRSCTTSPSHSHALEVHLQKADPDDDVIDTVCDKLVLRARSEVEKQRWLAGLQARIDQQAWTRSNEVTGRSASSEAAECVHPEGDTSPHALRPGPVATSLPSTPHQRSPLPSPLRSAPSRSTTCVAWAEIPRAEPTPATAVAPPSPQKHEQPPPEKIDARPAIAAATLAARRAAAKVEIAAAANELCRAMGAVDGMEPAPRSRRVRTACPAPLAFTRPARFAASPPGRLRTWPLPGCCLKELADVHTFLEQRQREVWAQLAEQEEHAGADVATHNADDMLAALGATPGGASAGACSLLLP